MVLQSQLHPQVGYAYPYGDEYSKNGYQHQDDYYSKHGYAAQQGYCPENAYYSSGSSLQQVKPYPNIATPQPSEHRHHQVGYEGYGQHSNGGGYGHGNHQKYSEYNSHGHDKHSMGKHHVTDGLYGKPHGYDHHDSYGYSAGYPNGPNNNTYETMNYMYYAEGRDRCPTSCQHPNQPNWWPSKGAQWIAKSLDD